MTPFLWAVKNGHEAAVATILNKDHTLLQQRCHEERTALHIATSEAYPAITKMIIDYGANVNARDLGENVPLDEVGSSIYSKRPYIANQKIYRQRIHETIHLLVEGGARPGPGLNKNGLWDHVRSGDISSVKTLLAAGASPNYTNTHGYPMLYHAKTDDMKSILIAAGADLDAKSSHRASQTLRNLPSFVRWAARNPSLVPPRKGV
jgi:ankyrin repeat protein